MTFIKGNTDSNSFPSEELLYRWDARDTNHVLRELSSSPYLLSLYAYMKDSGGKGTEWHGSASIIRIGFSLC